MATDQCMPPPPEPNPYREALEDLLNKIQGGGNEGVGQRRGIRRAIVEVDRVWATQRGVGS
jgi:hypothetical protein